MSARRHRTPSTPRSRSACAAPCGRPAGAPPGTSTTRAATRPCGPARRGRSGAARAASTRAPTRCARAARSRPTRRRRVRSPYAAVHRSDRPAARPGREAPMALTTVEADQVERANASGRQPVVFVHGLWLLPSSWDRWATLFEEAGYTALTPGWPDDPETVEEANAHPEVLAGKTVGQVADHFEEVIGGADKRPVLGGHPFGGPPPR